jgi:hypothetical protein
VVKELKICFLLIVIINFSCSRDSEIDRFSLVNRHNIEITQPDSLNSLSIGNGRFAFTVDITGLQTFPEYYLRGVPLGTMSEWGWHSEPNTGNYKLSDTYKTYNVHGRRVDYVHRYNEPKDSVRALASEYFRRNPHRVHLGMIGLELLNENDSYFGMENISDPVQKLDLWKGEIESRFKINNAIVNVLTVCHPDLDMISSKVTSTLAINGKLRVKLYFPHGISSPSGFGYNYPENDSIIVVSENESGITLKRVMDKDSYYIQFFSSTGKLTDDGTGNWFIQSADSVLEFSCLFSKEESGLLSATFSETERLNSERWEKYWLSGGAADFSECTDPRAFELERRVVLSQYLVKTQCAGTLPPAETGLTYNSWYGKFHLEMHWWHSVHYALWQRQELLEKQLDYYFRISEKAQKTAEHQGYKGVRWPKMTDAHGDESPSGVGTYLIWQQPHIIYFAEILYRDAIDKRKILETYKNLVFSTADFMASYAWFDTTANRYSLGPVLISAQESLKLETTINPSFELVYWYWGLKTAQEWRRRLGMEKDQKWADVISRLSPLPEKDGLYLCSEDTRDTWQNQRYLSDHPIISGTLGMLPETGLVDKKILSATLDTIQKKWNWNTCWGWDFPLLAMSAAALGRTEQAIDFLLMDAPKNRYLVNGHNYQDARLTIYLPGNGGILAAVASMCASNQFPYNGKWNVKWENLNSIR